MTPSDIDTDLFYSAHELALQRTPENRQEEEFVENLTRFLVAELERARIETVLTDRKQSGDKILKALQQIQQNKGIEFVTQYRTALLSALEHTLAARMTLSDMPPSVKESGLFKLDLPDGSADEE